jgi:hypothetical protein
MKTTFNNFRLQAATLFVLLNLFSINLSAQSCQPVNFSDSLLCLEISGKIKKGDNNDDKNVKVVLIYYNTPVDSVLIKGKQSFKFKLVKDAYYAIKIYRAGYAPRLISICTNLPEEVCNDRILRFHFTTHLVRESEFERFNQETRDFPVAIVSFNKSKKAFYYNVEYTSNIKRSLFQNETLASY